MSGPLDGIRVVDITTNISGPSLTMILADLGAEIIKVERPGSGDDSRSMGPILEDSGVYFLHINRNKRSIVVNLKTDEGRELLYDFVKTADVFVENLRLGKAKQLGFDYEILKALNPQIIYCSLTAYGQKGPLSKEAGYDAIVQADTGIMGISGTDDNNPSRAAVSILDQGSAMWGAIGILSAIYHRSQTGEGQRVDTSLYETGVFWVGYHMLSYMTTGEEPKKLGSNHGAFAPYGAFKTADDPFMIGVSNNSLFEKTCRALEKEEWIEDERFHDNPSRVKNRNELNYLIEQILVTQPAVTWSEKFKQAGVPCSIIRKVSEVITAEQTESCEMFTEMDHAKIGKLKLPRIPIKLSKSEIEYRKAPPLLGEDTVAILRERGLSESAIQELMEKNIIDAVNEVSKK